MALNYAFYIRIKRVQSCHRIACEAVVVDTQLDSRLRDTTKRVGAETPTSRCSVDAAKSSYGMEVHISTQMMENQDRRMSIATSRKGIGKE